MAVEKVNSSSSLAKALDRILDKGVGMNSFPGKAWERAAGGSASFL